MESDRADRAWTPPPGKWVHPKLRKQCCAFHRSGGKRTHWCGADSLHELCWEVPGECGDPWCPYRPGKVRHLRRRIANVLLRIAGLVWP